MEHDLHISNARIWTGDPHRPWARSLLIRDGCIAAVDPVSRPAGDPWRADVPSDAQVIDAHGRTIAPGFIDAHMHLIMGGLCLHDLDLREVKSPEDFKERIAQRHAELREGAWLIARNWSAENWGGSPMPGANWLDAAGERPVVCYRMDLHAAVVNHAVLQKCDLERDPPGGKIVRDENGNPTGLLLEAALWKLVNPLIPDPDVDAKQYALLAAQKHCHSLGITGVGTMEYARDVREVLLPMSNKLSLRCAVTLLDRAWPMDFTEAIELANLAGQGMVRVIGCKAFADGTLGSRTARMLADYCDDPGNRGMLVEIAEEGNLYRWAHGVAEAGFSPSIHAIGDEAVRLALDACERLPQWITPRIEHAQQIADEDIPRFACLGAIASMQPLHKADDGRYASSRLGPDRLRGFFPFRQLLKAHADLAFGSDWPVVSCDPIAGMHAAITGQTLDGQIVRPEENLTVEEALAAYTVGAARALGLSDSGTITEGAAANFVKFDIDPFTIDWRNQRPRVVMTVVDGETVYQGEAHVGQTLAHG